MKKYLPYLSSILCLGAFISFLFFFFQIFLTGLQKLLLYKVSLFNNVLNNCKNKLHVETINFIKKINCIKKTNKKKTT